MFVLLVCIVFGVLATRYPAFAGVALAYDADAGASVIGVKGVSIYEWYHLTT